MLQEAIESNTLTEFIKNKTVDTDPSLLPENFNEILEMVESNDEALQKITWTNQHPNLNAEEDP